MYQFFWQFTTGFEIVGSDKGAILSREHSIHISDRRLLLLLSAHDSRYICLFVIYVHSVVYFNTSLIVIVFVFCTCILDLNTLFCSAVLLKVSPDIEMLQLPP
jgi:hypothetical protein